MKSDDQNRWYYKMLGLLKLETTTKYGRVNLAGVLITAIFCLLYTAGDAVGYLISSISDTIKTIVLKRDIYHEYESISVIEAVIPIVIVFVLCLIFLAWHDYKKNK